MYSTATKRRTSEEVGGQQPMLPRNIVVGALRYADMVEGTGRMVAHEDVMAEIYRRRGWA